MRPFQLLQCSFAAATAPSLVLLLLLLFSLSTTQSLADANYSEISPISTDSHINQVKFDPDQPNSSLPLLIHNNNNINNNKKEDQTFEFNVTALRNKYLMTLQLVLKDHKDDVNEYGTLDTGSDLIWLEPTCKTTTAKACIKERPETPFKCQSDEDCKKRWSYLGMEAKCKVSTDHKYCGYKIGYKDGTSSEGYLGKGTFRFGVSDGHDQKLENMEYGVSTTTGTEQEYRKGVVGLGRGKLSLFQQLNNSARVEFKFSYCLPQYEEKDHSNKNALARSKLVFGSRVNTNPYKSTPLLDENLDEKAKDYCETRFYCVRLRSIYVKGRDKEKEITVKGTGTTEVMIIDSGSTFTSLRGELFTNFLKCVKEEIGGEVKEPEKPDGYEHCFEKRSAEKLEKVSLGFEETTVELKRENIFDLVKKDYLCLTVKKFVEGKKKLPNVHILGSRAQMDFKVAFDVPNKKVSFDKEETCNQEKKNSNDGVDHRIESSNVVEP